MPSSFLQRRLVSVAILAVLSGILVGHAWRYMPFFADDSFVSLRYAQRLLAGQGLTWTEGARVEGYSNLLWILSVSGLGALGIDLIDAARALGVLSGIATLAAVTRVASPASGLLAGVALCLCGPFAIWCIGGLEQPLLVAAIAWAVVALWRCLDDPERSPLIAGLPLAAVCLTRPDGPIFVVAFGLSLAVARRRIRPMILLGLAPVGAVFGQLTFRGLYYADWLPNPAYMKAAWSTQRLMEGLAYVGDGLWSLLPIILLAGLGVIAAAIDRARRARVLSAWIAALIWTGYVASVGGDIFPAHRHLLPTVVLLTFAGVEGIDWALSSSPKRWIFAVPIMGAIALLMPLQSASQANRRAAKERWEWDAQPIGEMLRLAFKSKDPLMAVTAAGALPYFSTLRCLDMLGLNDRHIARQAPKAQGLIGHDHADGTYVLDQTPDLFIWGLPVGGPPVFTAGRQVKADLRFRKGYRRTRFETADPRLSVVAYTRVAGPLGIEVSADQIRVPGYLFGGRMVGHLDAHDTIVGRLPKKSAVRGPQLRLPAGTWRPRLEPAEAALGFTVGGARPFRARAGAIEGPAVVYATLSTADASADLHAVVFDRVSGRGGAFTDRLQVRARPALVPVASRVLGAFDGPNTGWQMRGLGVTTDPVHGQAPIVGRVGGVLNSFLPRLGDRVQGSARSHRFVATPGMALRFRVAGGKAGVGVRLRSDRRILAQWQGQNDETLRPIIHDLTAHSGTELFVEVFDDVSRPWGHVVVDDVVLLQMPRVVVSATGQAGASP